MNTVWLNAIISHVPGHQYRVVSIVLVEHPVKICKSIQVSTKNLTSTESHFNYFDNSSLTLVKMVKPGLSSRMRLHPARISLTSHVFGDDRK